MKKFKVKGTYPEFPHGIDIVDELTKILSEELAKSIDREILKSIGFETDRKKRRKNSIGKIFKVDNL